MKYNALTRGKKLDSPIPGQLVCVQGRGGHSLGYKSVNHKNNYERIILTSLLSDVVT